MRDWVGNKAASYAIHGASNHSQEERAEHDYYATDPKAVKKLLLLENFEGGRILEPACGGCHISKVLIENGFNVLSFDKVNRNSPLQDGVRDFFDMKSNDRNIITNPPYKFAKEFVEHALDISEKEVKIAMFLKLTFLEGAKRRNLFNNYPPKRIYVFRNRIDCWKNGIKPEKASKAVCYAWFVWVKGYKGKPEIEWID